MSEPDLQSLSDLIPFAAAIGVELLEATPELPWGILAAPAAVVDELGELVAQPAGSAA